MKLKFTILYKHINLLGSKAFGCFRILLSASKALFAFCFLLLLFCLNTKAQTWEAGAFGGAAGYQGDLNQRAVVKPSGPAGGIFIQRNFNPYFSLKLNYTYGKIAGADSTSSSQQFRNRNLSFKTTLNELALLAELNFMPYTPGADINRFSPFIFLGAGLVNYKPTADYMGSTYALPPLMTEGQSKPYKTLAATIPFGAGVKYNFSGSWNIMLSAGYRYVYTDYLDDVSGNYAPRNSFSNSVALALSDRSGEKTGVYTGAAGTQRGDYHAHDSYMFIGLTLSFTFVSANCYY